VEWLVGSKIDQRSELDADACAALGAVFGEYAAVVGLRDSS